MGVRVGVNECVAKGVYVWVVSGWVRVLVGMGVSVSVGGGGGCVSGCGSG